ncbi:MAG: phosphate ABC transporter substrate-binding protein [Nitrospinae bacterium]|nr:phosphate ABC transporter substrate-binding protein [Nitrospinota bacterium]
MVRRVRRSRGFLPAMIVMGLLAVWTAAPGGATEEQTVRVAGSTTVLPVVSKSADRFKVSHKGVTVTVNAGGSGVGVNDVGNGRAQIGMLSRELTREEREQFKNAGLKTHAVGRDAVACVVSSEVYSAGVKTLSKEQIRDIYLGKIGNWKDVGGPDRRIVVIDKETHRGTRHVFMQYVFGDEQARAPGARLVTGSNNEEQTKVAQSDAAIGMLSIAWINPDVVGVGIRDGDRVIQPTLATVRDGSFPISRNLNLVTAGEPRGAVKEFIDFILGPEGQKIVEESGYVAVR